MAARTRRTTQNEKIREKIKLGLLVKRFEDHALGKVEMTPSQIRAGEILMRKSMPDLQSIEHLGDVDMQHTIRWAK